MNKRRTMFLILFFPVMGMGFAQNKPADSVVIRVGEASKVIFAIHDKKDLETLKHYDFQALMDDMITKLEKKDSTQLTRHAGSYLKDSVKESRTRQTQTVSSPDSSRNWTKRTMNHWNRRTYHAFNMDLGTNNYLSNGKFPDQTNQPYAVRPWGSWYVALNSVQRTHVAGKFFLEWGVGVSWYNFKFQNDMTVLSKNDNGVSFLQDNRSFDFIKSKLTATYLNATFVPMIDFGKGGKKTTLFDGSRVDFSSRGNHSSAFRIGVGPYAGYRIDSYAKQSYRDQGDKHRDHDHDTFYLNTIRYGARLQMGFRDVDLFFNYDMNNLFVDNKGPKVNAFSFGVTF
ncbi:MAG TPA: hypothetical protein VK517_00730 [Cyclobacteriaceae bacterium]|nr:hypothetical protein [Cyclobacteriaceae bacterium]